MVSSLNPKNDYATYRLEKAFEEYASAEVLLKAEHYRAANNRAYYAIFHGMRAVLVFDDIDSKKHSGIISEFRKNYIKTGIFPEEYSNIIGNASEIRNASDYDDMFIAVKAETIELVTNAKTFLDGIKRYVEQKIHE